MSQSPSNHPQPRAFAAFSCALSLLPLITLPLQAADLPVPAFHHALVPQGSPDLKEPYQPLHGGAFTGPEITDSPDPLVRYHWENPQPAEDFQIYFLKPIAVQAEPQDAFDNTATATADTPAITVKAAGAIRLDFGVESPAWIEIDSPDCPGDVTMGISEYNEPAPNKNKPPAKHANTYRLELNRELYEGVRFAWINVKTPATPWHITGLRAVCQVKPTNYKGSFSCSDPLLTKIWYMSAYGVKASLCKDYFGAILMDRGDRMSWTGDAHTSQAAALAAFGNFDFIKKNIDHTSGQSNGIRSYSLYWVLSLLDYYKYTGDRATLDKYIDNVCAKLDEARRDFGQNPNLRFYGWDERLCAGFEIWFKSCQEAQYAYQMLSIRAWKEFADVMDQCGKTELRDKYSTYAAARVADLKQNTSPFPYYGLHATADAINAGVTGLFPSDLFTDRVNRLSFSPFNQYFIIQAMARLGKYDDALSSIRDMWGGMIQYGGTTPFEVYRPSWNQAIAPNAPVPNSQSGIVSLCHPWGAGVVKWLNEEVLGIKPVQPGFKTWQILPHPGATLTRVAGSTPTPSGPISASFDFATGACTVTAPAGTTGRIGIPKAGRTIQSVTVNGKPVDDIGGDKDFVYLTNVGPGTYAITVTCAGKPPAYKEPAVKYAAELVRTDSLTGGNWGGVYGKDGYVLCNYHGGGHDEKSLPSYVTSLDYFRAFPKNGVPDPTLWAEKTTDKRALSPNVRNSPERTAACYSNIDQTMTVTIGIDGKRDYRVALYFVDWEKKGLRTAVEMFDAATLNLIAPVQVVDQPTGGTYLVYHYDKSVKFRMNKVRGDLVTLSGIFFDSGPAALPIKDYGVKDYVRLSKDLPHSETNRWNLVCEMPYNCHFQPVIEVDAPTGSKISFNSSNPLVRYLVPTESVTTEAGTKTYEAKNWVSGEGAIYSIPAGATVKSVKYHETGYDTTIAGSFECNDNDYNILWKKAARTAYVCMRDHFYDCPDRERVGFWGDGTPELDQCFYVFDKNAHRLASDLVRRKLEPKFYPGQHLEFLGDYGLWFYYMQTGDIEAMRDIYEPTKKFLFETYQFGNPHTWFDWGKENKDTAVIETCFYDICLQSLRKIAQATGHEADLPAIDAKLAEIKNSFNTKFWKNGYYMSDQVTQPDDRANAMAVNAGLAEREKWPAIYDNVLTKKTYSSCFFDRWVFEALCIMGKQDYALLRMYERYKTMIPCSFTTLWEHYDRWWASRVDAFDEGSSLNHGWNPPALFLSQTIAGVSPVEPGWKTYQILPKEAFLTSIKVVVPTIKGNVTVALKKTATEYAMDINSPDNTLAIVGIPKGSFTKLDSIEVNGKTIWPANGAYSGATNDISHAGEDDRYIKFKMPAGTWKLIGHGTLPLTSPKPPQPPPANDIVLDKKSWTATASVPDGTFPFSGGHIPVDIGAANALDGDHWTGWRDLTNKQYPGQWFQVDMQQAQTFDKIVLDNTWALWDSPAAYSVTVSNDGTQWSEPIATGKGNLGITTITFPKQSARYIKITQTGSSDKYHWSIYELDVCRTK